MRTFIFACIYRYMNDGLDIIYDLLRGYSTASLSCFKRQSLSIFFQSTYGRNTDAYRLCSSLDQAGIFSRCFSKVDPSSYLKSCMNMHQMAGKMGPLHVCRIFLMYVSKCRAEGITLQMPRNCRKCFPASKVPSCFYITIMLIRRQRNDTQKRYEKYSYK